MIYIKHNYLEDCCVQYFKFLDDYLNNMHLSCFVFFHVFLFVYLFMYFPNQQTPRRTAFNLLLKENILHYSIYPAYFFSFILFWIYYDMH